jgi:hypothetical protein
MPIAINSQDARDTIAAGEKSLKEMALYDIYRSLRRKPPTELVTLNTNLKSGIDAIASSYILGCCLIEAAGHFLIPCPSLRSRSNGTFRADSQSQKAFEAFCTEFLPGYDGNVLYKATRCGLAHSYTLVSSDTDVPETYWLTHNEAVAHLQPDAGDPRIRYINAQNFIVDLHNAIDSFFSAVRLNRCLISGLDAQRTFLDWAEFCGLMSIGASPNRSPASGSSPSRVLWGGRVPPAITGPVIGVGSSLSNATAPGMAVLSNVAVCASGWAGVSELGIGSSGFCIASGYNPLRSVSLPAGIRAIPKQIGTGKPAKKIRNLRATVKMPVRRRQGR